MSSLPAAAGCGDEDDPEPSRFAWLATRAEEVRELSFEREVPVRTISRAEVDAEAEQAADAIDEEALAALAATYGRLGFFPPDTDLQGAFGQSMDVFAAWYSTESKAISLIGEVEDNVLVHEYVHGLQDQHFDLGKLLTASLTSDAHLALRAAIEGDAMLAEVRFLMQEANDADLDRLNWAVIIDAAQAAGEQILEENELPALFVDYPSFAYGFGFEYCAHNLTGASAASPTPDQAFPFDWSRQDALFSDRIPATTQQILTLDGQDPVVRVGLEEVPPALADRLEALDWDSLGEWLSYLLLRPLDGALELGDMRALAAAWDGDRALFVRDRKTGAAGTAWASAWDDVSAAAVVESALWSLYGGAARDEGEPRLGQAADGELVWIERREERVVALKNIDEALLPALAEAAFASGIKPMRLTLRKRPSLSAWLSRRLPGPR
ncbi:hypothetical protein BE04_38895 [Sorangium cellulosum]|uniref:Uncharacterized protein n=3 Tax=Sorangium cellulosum TaxID=56 RepID=A0A150Q704_SORCE|nr:hypothetical protein SCE1572_02355 [Sorangium cellulosum So0157-2]KYF63730.1 hypothetical protein BE04_38895 [Sorangium cellulosum]